MAVRLPAYSGVVAARARVEDTSNDIDQTDGLTDSSAAVLMTDPVFGSMFDFGEVS